MRIRDRLAGKAEGPRGLYLCHGFCELGATPLPAALGQMHEFLVQNPNEVLVLVIEDYVSPQDLAAAFTASGLDGLVYRGAAGPPWPTLREMIDTRQRVLVLTESGRPGVAWIHPAFEVMQETPYHFEQPVRALVRAQPRRDVGLALPDEQLDRHHPRAQAEQRPDRQRLRRAPRPRAAVPGRAGQAADRDRGGLLPHGRALPRGSDLERVGGGAPDGSTALSGARAERRWPFSPARERGRPGWPAREPARRERR